MLRIRPAHLQALAAAAEERSRRHLMAYARQRFPSVFAGVDDRGVYQTVVDARTAAARCGIVREDNIASFLDLYVMYGPGFAGSPWAADVLGCDALHGPDKMALLRDRVAETGVEL